MLGHNDVVATVPVADMGRARKFYEDVLGLVLEGTMEDLLTTYRAGDSRVFVYKTISPNTTRTVVATWAVDDNIELLVQELLNKGVSFEPFEKEGFEKQDNLYHSKGMKVALFKDPDGNKLSLFQVNAA